MKRVTLSFPTLESLFDELSSRQDRDLDLSDDSYVADDWVAVTLKAGSLCLCLPAQVHECGDEKALAFGEREWEHMCCFAGGKLDEPPPPSDAPERVLVIDDAEHVRQLVAEMLAEGNLQTECVESAEQGLDKLRQIRVSLIVVDWDLPGMSGIEFCRRARKDPRTSGIPILFLSSRCTPSEVEQALEAGADDYVEKPFRQLELRARVCSLLHCGRISLLAHAPSADALN